MWKGLVRAPQGRISLRKFTMLFATLLVAVFGYTLATSSTSYAVDHDANWNGGNLSYDARDYTGPKTAEKNDKSTLLEGTVYYATYDTGNARTGSRAQGYIIYFEKGADPAKTTSAYYTFGFFDIASGKFSNLSPPKEITVDTSTYGNAETIEPSSCDVSGIGWVVCPVSNWIAEGMDYLYNIIASYLTVSPITSKDSGLYEMWSVVRNIANICFIIGFLILIYAQVTGGTISNYTIKKMLPRVIIAAVLVNVSYWICAIAVDLSNILGASVQNMFMAMQERIGAANSGADDIGWQKVTAAALGGGSLAAYGIYAAIGGGAGALSFGIIAALVPALFAVFVAVVILAARQALITVMIVLAPLAFVAYLLPNTEDWFKRWRKLFTTLMIMFPAFAVIFGGAQLTGVLIIQNASTLPVVLLGLLVQVIPLFITPFLIKLSSGLMGAIAGMANDRSKGVFDRTQNWAKDRQQASRSAALARGLSRHSGKRRERFMPSYVATGKQRRDAIKAKNDEAIGGFVDAAAGRSRTGRRAYARAQDGGLAKHASEESNFRTYKTAMATGTDARNAYRRQLHHQAHVDKGIGDLYEEGMTNHSERDLKTQINDLNGPLRNVKIQADVDAAHAKFQAEQIEAAAGRVYADEFDGASAAAKALRHQRYQIIEDKKVAESIDKKINARGEARFERISTDTADPQFDANIRRMRVEEFQAGDDLKRWQTEWSTFIKDVQHQGSGAAGVTPDITRLAESVKNTSLQQHTAQQQLDASETALSTYIEELRTEKGADQHGMLNDANVIRLREAATQKRAQTQRQANAQGVANLEYAQNITKNSSLADTAGGIDDYGAKRAVSAATKAIIDDFGKNVDSEKTTMSKLGDQELFAIATDQSLSNERRAAAAGKIMSNGSMASIHKLVETMQQAQPVDDDERSAVRDIQMQMHDDMNRTPFGMGDTDKSALRRGELGQDTPAVDANGDIVRDSRGNPIITAVDTRTLNEMFAYRVQNKMSGDTWIGMDPDDRTRIVNLAQTDQGRALLGDQGMRNLMTAFDEINDTPEMRGRLKTDGKRAANAIAVHLGREEPFNLD